MFSSIISLVNEMLIALSNGMNKNFFNYNILETAMDRYTIVSKQGYLLSIIKIDGIRDIISQQNYYNNIIYRLSQALGPSLESSGHIIQSCFQYNPTKSTLLIDKYLKPSYETAKRLNLDLEYILDSQRETLKDAAAEEKNFLLVWTTTSILSKQEIKKSTKLKIEEFKDANLPIANSGNPFVAHEMIYERHRALYRNIINELSHVGLVVSSMTAVEGIREIRMGIDEEYTSEDWTPALPGDTLLPTQRRQNYDVEEYDVLPTKLSQQICNKDATIEDANIVKIGNLYYAPIYINLMPKMIEPFYAFFSKAIQHKMPWRILYTITGDKKAVGTLKHTFSQILHATSTSNQLMNASYDFLKQMSMSNQTIIKFQIALCTWADSKTKAQEQVSQLARVTESWGHTEVSEVTGNPITGVASASMGFTTGGISTVSIAPLEDAISMLPFSRPSALWESGSVLFKSPDGKILPYQPMAPIQETWITLIFASPGSGKSVLANLTNTALCFSAGIERLPMISILDIGPSSEGFIQMIQDALPPNQKQYALYSRVENSEKYCMNPFDLKLGCRVPFAVDREYLINFITLLMTDATSNDPEPGVMQYVSELIDETYKYYSDSPSFPKRSPKLYRRLTNLLIDETLKKLGVTVFADNEDNMSEIGNQKVTTWFEVVDILMQHGCTYEAMIAQRYAVPTLQDLTNVAQKSDSIKDLYKDFKIGSEHIGTAFNRMITSAIKAYPILSGVTSYDLGEARIVSLNLDQVARSGGAQADRQTAVMYMYGLKLLSGDFFLDEGNLDELPFKKGWEAPHYTDVVAYKEFHRKRIKEIRADKKRLFLDEFHRTSASSSVRSQILVYMREGRKWGVEVVLSSQLIDDFDEKMISLAKTIFVLSAGKNETVQSIVSKIGINDEAEIDVLRNRLRGPGEGGNVFMAKFETKRGNVTQLLNNKMGAVPIWAFSTTTDDVIIRKLMFEAVGSTNGRKILAEAFLSGSAANEVLSRQKTRTHAGRLTIHEEIVQEQIRRFGPKYGISRNQEFF